MRMMLSCVTVGMIALLGAGWVSMVQADERPNVVLIMTDDQGYGDFGCMGNPVIETPHLDAMSERSVSWSEFYVSPVCSPTRASLMTGRYNPRTMVVDTWLGRSMMPEDEITLAEVLRDAGYATGIFGKWHLGDNYPMRPGDQGFEESLVHRGGGIGQPADPRDGGSRYTNPVLLHNDYEVVEEGYCTDVFFARAGEFMDRAQGEKKPFFAYISLNAPHSPYHDVPDALYQKYLKKDMLSIAVGEVGDREKEQDVLARIAAMITNIDDNVGGLLENLRQDGIHENTIVVFLTDNGPNSRRYVGKFRGKKTELYEGGIRTPFWIEWPAKLAPATVETSVAAHIDLMPTLLEACGVESAELPLDGRSLLSKLQDPSVEMPVRPVVIQYHRGDRLVKHHSCMVRKGRYKLVHASGTQRPGFDGEPKWELYDLKADPGESEDLAERQAGKKIELLGIYDRWFSDVTATRMNEAVPPAIVVDRAHENPCVLTWQDAFGGQWNLKHPGKWKVKLKHGGRMDVRVELPQGREMKGEGWGCKLRVGKQRLELPLGQGKDWVTFEALSVEPGEQLIEARFVREGAKEPVAAYHVRLLHR